MSNSKRIKVNLADSKSFKFAEQYLYQMETETKKAVQDSLHEIGERVKNHLIEELCEMGLCDSSFINQIVVKQYGKGLSVYVTSQHMMYVEFGTGIVGSNDPHPNTSFMDESWEYDINHHGEKGWWYPTTSRDKNKNKKVGANGQLYAFTKGQRSRPFMYNTWLYSRRIAVKIFNKHLGRV